MTPIEYCRNKAQKSGSSFLAGFKFLYVKQQDAMTALYAYCRELDDVVDECSDVQVARQTLAWWRQDLDAVYTQNGQPEHPVHQALKMYVAEFSFPKNELEELINGMEMDLHHARYQTFEDLPKQLIKQIEFHFNHYKDLKKPGTTVVKSFEGVESAKEVIKAAIKRWNDAE